MKYPHPIDRAIEYAESALDRILQEKLPPNPVVFELFYVYYAQDDLDLVRAMDIMVSGGYDLTEQRCYELYARFLNMAIKAEASMEQASHIMETTLANVEDAKDGIKNSTTRFEQSNRAARHNVGQARNEKDLREVVAKVITESQKIVEENRTLEERLSDSMTAMQKLHAELETIRAEAMTDALTGAPNRKLFDMEISRLSSDADLNNTSMVLLMIDIDHFKKVNDNYGHQTGDQVLRLVARVLRDNIKGRDVYARYGGEEFAVILPNTFITDAIKLANMLRESVAGKEVLNRNTGQHLGRVTLSIGVAQLAKGEEPSSVIERADAALYKAKRSGRNQVMAADPYVPKKTIVIPR